MTLAIARICDANGNTFGTAFAISRDRAMTAFHCVRDQQRPVGQAQVILQFRSGRVDARVEHYDVRHDFAVLRWDPPLPHSETPVFIGADCRSHERWYSVGFPNSVHPPDRAWRGGLAFTGTISDPESEYLEVPTVQLYCDQSAASQALTLQGASGAPVLVGTPPRAIGIVRWNIPSDGPSEVAVGATVFACSMGQAAANIPVLGRLLLPAHQPEFDRDPAAEKALMRDLPLARRGSLQKANGVLVLLLTVLLLGTTGTVAAARSVVGHHGKAGSSQAASDRPTGTRPSRLNRPTHSASKKSTTSPRIGPNALSVSPKSAAAGQRLTVTGHGFQPGERITLTFQAFFSAGTATATSGGDFRTHVAAPSMFSGAGIQLSIVAQGNQGTVETGSFALR